MSRNGAYKPCTWASRISYRNVSPRTSQLHARTTLPRRARRMHNRRPQGYQSDCARNLNSNHLQWVRTSPWNPRAARYHTSEITTTFGVRAPGIMTTFGTRASENTTPSGTRAPEITTTFGTRASESTTTSGTRAPTIKTTFGTRASENTTPSGTRAPENTSMIGTRAPVKSTKCNLFRTSVPFLGHIVGRAGLECDPNKVSAVANWIPPSTIKGVREFLGFTGYYRRFVPDYSTVAQPLVRLLGKDCKFKWTDACQDAFKALRALLIKAPVLAFPKEDLPYIVDTDASDYGIGGVLSQCIEGTEHVIAYYSKSLNPAQQKYCTTRRELLAVVATLDHFKGYVWGPKFVVRTDHAALVWLKNLKNMQGMLARWLAKLQQFHFEIIHRPGAQHGNADGLSRCPQCERGDCAPVINSSSTDPEQPYASSCIGSSLDSELIPLESGETCIAAVMIAQSENSKLITSAQMTDSEITIVRNWLIDGTFPARIQDFAPASYELKAYWIGRKSLFLDENNILWRKRSDAGARAQLVVPRSMRDTIFNDSHHTMYGGHFGITHTHSKLQLHYFWPGMSDFVRDRISACHKCVARKSPVNRHHPMGHVPVSGRFERVAMDLLDVSVISAKGYKYILVVCDYFTKYTEAYPLKDKTARSVADALMDIWLPRYGFPLFLHSDQGKEFDNAMIHKLSELLGTVKTKTTPYHPRSDGLVERFNRTLLAMLAMFVSQEHNNWDDLLPFMMLAYNTTVHTTTGFTPYRLVFGDECNLPGNLVHRELHADPPPGDPGTYASWVQEALYESYDSYRCARSNKERLIVRSATMTARQWRALSPLDAGHFGTTLQPGRTSYVRHG